MPRRKAKVDASSITPNPATTTSAEPADCVPKDLAGWIRHLEDKYIKLTGGFGGKWPKIAALNLRNCRRMAKHFGALRWIPFDRGLYEEHGGSHPGEATFQEALWDRLLILWADEMLWGIIRKGQIIPPPPPHTIDDFVYGWILRKYHLTLHFPASVWLEMVRNPVQRAHLFLLMQKSASDFFWVQSVDPEKDLSVKWRNELSEPVLGALLHKYVHNPAQDWRHVVLLNEYPKEVLEAIRSAAKKLADDIGYVMKHPERLDAQRAPPMPHRVRTLADARRIEQMVARLCQQPTITDGSLAKECLGRITGAGRKLAHEAKNLARDREEIPVTFHRSKGEKPKPG